MESIQIIGSIMAATGKSIPDIAKEKGITKMLFYRVINGESVNKNVRNLISEMTNKPLNDIWPEPAKRME